MHKFSKWHGLGSCSEISGICCKDKKAFVNFQELIRQVKCLQGRKMRSGFMLPGKAVFKELSEC